MALTDLDRKLLERCLVQEPGAWELFVDRFIGLFLHVIDHTAQCRSATLTIADRDDLCAEIFLALVDKNSRILRRFRGRASLASYLAVVARRVVVRILSKRRTDESLDQSQREPIAPPVKSESEGREQLQHMLSQLSQQEAALVEGRHVEGRSYRELSEATGLSENAVGPALSRAREKLRQQGE